MSIPVGTRFRKLHDSGLRLGAFAFVALASFTMASATSAQTGATITTFDIQGATAVFVQSINSGGSVTGSYNDTSGYSRGFVRTADGTILTFDPKGSMDTSPTGINRKGAIAGIDC